MALAQLAVHTIISGNSSNDPGGGIENHGTANVKSSLIALNSAESGADGSGTFVSQVYNVVNKTDGTTGFTQPTDQTGTIAMPLDPRHDPNGLQNNGGPTQTIALLANSPAINHGAPDSPPQDQRGYGRAGVPDVRAFEFGRVLQEEANVMISTVMAILTTCFITRAREPRLFGI
jgi:hypothetical protein